jgi:hypothetical protein
MSMTNIKFDYLYRDAGNYKNWASVVFANPEKLPLDLIMESLQEAFLQDGLFIAHQVRVPEAFFYTKGDATSDDHCFHEFDGAELSLEVPSDVHARTITQFIAETRNERARGWTAFDPHDRIGHRKVRSPAKRLRLFRNA